MTGQYIAEMKGFIEQVYFVDVCAIGAMYAGWLKYGSGVANYRAVPDLPTDTKGTQFDLPGGTIFNGDLTKHLSLLAENIGKGDTRIFNEPVFPKGEQQGFGFHEAPCGTLSHWIVIENGAIKNYQAVVPSTWNADPRDAKDQPGPYEPSLVGNPIADAERPLEVLRTVHSFDPCIACAIHTPDVDGRELAKVRAL